MHAGHPARDVSRESLEFVRVAGRLLRIGPGTRVQCVVRIRTLAPGWVFRPVGARRVRGAQTTAGEESVPPLPSENPIRVADRPYRHSSGWQIACGLTITWGSRADSGRGTRDVSAGNQGSKRGFHNLVWLVALVRLLQFTEPEVVSEPAGSAVYRRAEVSMRFRTQEIVAGKSMEEWRRKPVSPASVHPIAAIDAVQPGMV